MNSWPELPILKDISSLICLWLPRTGSEDLPAEIAEALEMARGQMRDLPAVIADLEAARRSFADLDQALGRMITLARESALSPEDDQDGRDAREIEFIRLAQMVARTAGRRYYAGPELSVKTRPQAEAALRILKHLEPVRAGQAVRIEEQTTLLERAISETINFLEIIAETYPEAASLALLPDLLRRVEWVRRNYQPDDRTGLVPAGGLN
ncbi:MAG: hypothetical protein AB1641_10490 [Thermodesulfobacteriota bacterium]